MITIIVPTINPEKAKQASEIMLYRAGIPCEIVVFEDTEGIGWVAGTNRMYQNSTSRYFVYAADDVYPSRGWLKGAFEQMQSEGAGIVAFNEGKYQHLTAGFGLVDREWVKNVYKDNLLCPDYSSHFADVEIALIAKSQGKFAYNPRNCLFEIVYNKDGPNAVGVNKKDHETFWKRAETGFNGLTNPIRKG